MPVEPEVQDSIEIELPRQPEPPLREGEERYRAGIALEDARRRDSRVEELRRELERLAPADSTNGAIRTKYASSASARRRQIAHRKKLEELQKLTFKRGDHYEGPCAPATIINLNPAPLKLFGELQRWSVPPAGEGLLIKLKFRNREFLASYMTIKTPHLYPVMAGTTNDKSSGVDLPTVDYQYIPPMGLVHQFFEHYVEGAADAQHMGGILIFEGDIHSLEKSMLERNEGCIWWPKKETTLEGFGDVVYVAEMRKLDHCMEQAVTMQRNFCDGRINEGHAFATSQNDILRNQLNDEHRTWHNFAVKMGYLEKPLSWAVERLRDNPSVEAVYCPDCHSRQESPEQHFCRECNAPFDALKSFLAGKTVSPDRLAVYEGEEWEAIQAEMQRRRAKIALLEEPAAETETKRNRKKKLDEADD